MKEFIWEFDEAVLNKFEEIYGAGFFEETCVDIKNCTNLTSIATDYVSGKYSSEDDFNDDVNIALQIIKDKYESLQEDNLL